MKVITVNNIVIQLDAPDNITDSNKQKEFVINTLDSINEVLGRANLVSQPQILTSGIDKADIIFEDLDGIGGE